MNKARLKIGRGVLLDRFGKPFYFGNLNFGPLWTISFRFRENEFAKTMFFILTRDHPYQTKYLNDYRILSWFWSNYHCIYIYI